MWVTLAIVSALCLGFYDVMKKLSVDGNNVLGVLFLNTVFGSLFMLPIIVVGVVHGNYGLGNTLAGHGAILIKSAIVLSSWLLGYASIKHLPLTIAGRSTPRARCWCSSERSSSSAKGSISGSGLV